MTGRFANRISRCFDSLCDNFEEENAVRLFVDRFKLPLMRGMRLPPPSSKNTPKGWLQPSFRLNEACPPSALADPFCLLRVRWGSLVPTRNIEIARDRERRPLHSGGTRATTASPRCAPILQPRWLRFSSRFKLLTYNPKTCPTSRNVR